MKQNPSHFLILISLFVATISFGVCDTNFGARVDLGVLTYGPMQEASGLAVSRFNDDVFWTHQDAGDGNYIYALNAEGRHLGRYRIDGFIARDWEDIAVGPGPQPGVSYLYVGNIGDNHHQYTDRYLARFPEPMVDSQQSAVDITLYGADIIPFAFPGGARPDCETLMIDPTDLSLYLVSKQSGTADIYALPYPQSTTGMNTAVYQGTIEESWIVGGDISPDGSEILLKHGNKIYYWCRQPGQTIGQAMTSTSPLDLPYIKEQQGEAVAWAHDRSGYYTLSEGHDPHLYVYPSLIDNEEPVVQITTASTIAKSLKVEGLADDNQVVKTVDYELSGTTSGSGTCSFVAAVLIPARSEWAYKMGDVELDPGWTDIEYDDTGWDRGEGQLGYGDGDETTVVGYVSHNGAKNITTYYRKEFHVENAGLYTNPIPVKVQRDDGIIVFVNGDELFRDRMPGGPVTKDTRASVSTQGSDEDEWIEYMLPPEWLQEGENVISAEIHQFSSGSSDTTFDLQLGCDQQQQVTKWFLDLELNPGTTRLKVSARDEAGNESYETLDIHVDPDGDNDGMPDDWEEEFLRTTDRDGTGDMDLDGQSDFNEWFSGTDPDNADDVFQIPALNIVNGQIQLTWQSVPGKSYRLMCASRLDSDFEIHTVGIAASTNTLTSITIHTPNIPCAYFRVDVEAEDPS